MAIGESACPAQIGSKSPGIVEFVANNSATNCFASVRSFHFADAGQSRLWLPFNPYLDSRISIRYVISFPLSTLNQ